MGKRELVALLSLSSRCLVINVALPRGLTAVRHTHYFLIILTILDKPYTICSLQQLS